MQSDALSLLDIAEAITVSFDALDKCETDEERDALMAAIHQSVEVDLPAKADGIAWFCKRTEAEIDQLKALKQAVDRKIAAKQDRIVSVRAMVLSVMRQLDAQKLCGKVHTLSIRKGSERIDVSDVNALPEDYRHAVVAWVPDKDGIRAALRRGEEISGARIVCGEESLQIR